MKPGTPRPHIAHVNRDGVIHHLSDHLKEVGALTSEFATKFNLPLCGELIGLLHDVGKYSADFQNYIMSATGLLDQDVDEEAVDHLELKGKIDHSTAGAQWVYRELSKYGVEGQVVGQFLSMCIASHHSGLIDCIDPNGVDVFARRSDKPGHRTHLVEVMSKVDTNLRERILYLANSPALREEMMSAIKRSMRDCRTIGQRTFNHGLLLRFLFSCLIDADRKNTAEFRFAGNKLASIKADWNELANRIERHISSLSQNSAVNELRRSVSQNCLLASDRKPGIYTLTVPTGGAKTISSLRFGVHHAWKHGMQRIINVLPYTAIIDQNAQVARKILEPEPSMSGSVVVEHHSNLTPEKDSWKNKALSENWDAPIIYTTMVQLLEALFSDGTRDVRRLHRLSNCVIIFDEIQALPLRTFHMFCNTINFIVDNCNSTVVLCTATQPVLHKLNADKGSINLSHNHEIMPDVKALFKGLKRVKLIDKRKRSGWKTSDLARFTNECIAKHGSCLFVANTKAMALALYELCVPAHKEGLFHLSTHMCPAHRKEVLRTMQERLAEGKPTLCISTQLIEAGVDIDFGCVIRSVSGLDSLAQAAGRCNRNGRFGISPVYIVNPIDENLTKLDDIVWGQWSLDRFLRDFEQNPAEFDDDPLGDAAIQRYFSYYFASRQEDMDYPVEPPSFQRSDTLLELLSTNKRSLQEMDRCGTSRTHLLLRQSFMSAARTFQAIDSPTRSVIVPYNEAACNIIESLNVEVEQMRSFKLLREAQQFSINVFPNVFDELVAMSAIEPIGNIGVFLLKKEHYDDRSGLIATQKQTA
jgi:CRISPR-associated endonuclease/helicase Cas3